MTVSEKSSRKVIVGAGWTNPLTHDFQIENASYAHVFADDVELVGGVDYVVSDVLNPAGYTITIVAPGSWAPTKWVLDARPPIDQGKDLTVGGTFGAKYEDGLDKLARRVERVWDLARRGLKTGLSIAVGDNPYTLPAPSAGQFLRWKLDGTDLENAAAASGTVVISDDPALTDGSHTDVTSEFAAKSYADSKVIDDVALTANSATQAASQKSLKTIVGPPNATGTWLAGKAPAIISRAVPKFLMPEMYIGLDTQIVYCPSTEPQDFSGATNFKPAFDAMRTEMLASLGDTEWPPTSTYNWKQHKFGIALQPGYRYAIDGGINFTGFQTRGLLFQGNGASIVGRYAGGAPMLDLIGSAGWIVRDLSVQSDNAAAPNFGVMIGRNVSTQTCERMRFDNVIVDGWFQKASMYNYASEVFLATNLQAFSYMQDVPAFWLDSRNTVDIAAYTQMTGTLAAVGDDASCVTHKFVGGVIRNIQENQYGAMRIDSARNTNLNMVRGVTLDRTYLTNNGVDTDPVRPAVRIRGNTEDMDFNLHAELSAADSVVNLSHVLYYDTSDLLTPMRAWRHRLTEYFADAEIAVIDKTADAGELVMSGFEAHVGWSRGQYPAGTDAKLFGANMGGGKVRITGKITTGEVPATFINANATDFAGDLETAIDLANVGVGFDKHVNLRSAFTNNTSYTKLGIKTITANGAIALNGFDVAVLTGSVSAISFANNNRYHRFTVINQTANFVVVSGLAGPNVLIPPNLSLLVQQLGTLYYAEPMGYTGVYLPVPVIVANLDAVTIPDSDWRYTMVGTHCRVSGRINFDPTAAANTATSARVPLPVASNLVDGSDLSGSLVNASGLSVGKIDADATNDQALISFLSNTTANTGYTVDFEYQLK